jgi:hypothetical protein
MAETNGDGAASGKKKKLYLVFVRFLELITALTCVLVVVANILLLIGYGGQPASVDIVFAGILRVYNMFFSILCIAAIFDAKLFVKYMLMLDTWIGLGFMLIFNAVLLLSVPGGDFDMTNYTNIIRVVAGWVTLGLGVVFGVLGLFAGKNKKLVMQMEMS